MKQESAFGFEKPKDSPGYLLWRTTTAWQRKIKAALVPFNVSHTQFVIMAALMWFTQNKEPINQASIASMSGIDKMTVSKSIKKLISEGLVKRRDDIQDMRAAHLALTKKGLLLIQKLVPLVEQVDAEYFGCLSPEDQSVLISLFNKLV